MDNTCMICQKDLSSSPSSVVGDKGLQTLVKYSGDRKDGLHETWAKLAKPIRIHVECRKNYTRASTRVSEKRKQDTETPSSPTKLRSKSSEFRIKEDCLYCSKPVISDKNKPKESKSSCVETLEYIQNVLIKSKERADTWGRAVETRIMTSSDLVAAEGKYHRQCAQRFYAGCHMEKSSSHATGRPCTQTKSNGFEKLCKYLDENDECQFSSTELYGIYENLCDDEDVYIQHHLHHKLQEHYGNNLVATKRTGKPTVYSFRDHGHTILTENWEKKETVIQQH